MDKGIKKVKVNIAKLLKASVQLCVIKNIAAARIIAMINHRNFGKIYEIQISCVTIPQEIGWDDGIS